MAYVSIVKPVPGEPTRIDTFASQVIDDLNFLNDSLSSAAGANILNGSFEANTGVNTAPTSWTLAAAAGNSSLIETAAANVRHGAQSFKMTTPGSIGGGVSIVTTDFYAIGEVQSVFLSWFMKSTVAGIRNQAFIRWYDNLKNLILTTTLYDSVTNSTVWTRTGSSASAPAGARFFKCEFLGVNNTVAGSVWFDGVSYQVVAKTQLFVLTVNGSWVCPADVYRVKVKMAGGGGGNGHGTGGGAYAGGGGGGCYLEFLYDVTPGVSYPYLIGGGGTGENPPIGAGGPTVWNGSVTAPGGAVGNNNSGGIPGTGGAGGSTPGSSTMLSIPGQQGTNGAYLVAGGACALGPGTLYGCGAIPAANVQSNGSQGVIILETVN